jgi:hypothetical protein
VYFAGQPPHPLPSAVELPIQARRALGWPREMQVLRQKPENALNLLNGKRLRAIVGFGQFPPDSPFVAHCGRFVQLRLPL